MDPVEAYVEVHSKSKATAFFLALFFGPLGVLYSNWVAAIILAIVTISTVSTVIIPLFCWILSILIGIAGVDSHNERVRAAANILAKK